MSTVFAITSVIRWNINYFILHHHHKVDYELTTLIPCYSNYFPSKHMSKHMGSHDMRLCSFQSFTRSTCDTMWLFSFWLWLTVTTCPLKTLPVTLATCQKGTVVVVTKVHRWTFCKAIFQCSSALPFVVCARQWVEWVVEWCATRMTILPSQHLKRITGNSYYYMASDFVVVLYPSLKIEFLERRRMAW